MAPSHHDREEETLIAYFQQMLDEVDDEEFDGELQEQGDMQAAPADESSYSKEANESVLTSANAAIDANHAALASTGASSTIVSAQGEVSSKTIAGSDSLTVSATNAAVVTHSVVSKGLNEQSAPLKTEPSNLESAKASTEGIVISSAADETVSATQAQEQEVATGSSVDRDYDAISKEPFISIDEEEPSTSEFVQIGIQPKAVTSSVTTSSSTAAVQSKTVVTTTPDSTEVIHTHTTDDAIVIEKVVSGTSVEDAEHVADDKEAQSSESSSDSIAEPSVAERFAQEDAEQSSSESGNKSASESANEIPVDAESAADAAMIAAAEQSEKDKADAAAAESAADAAMIAAAEQSEKDKADAVAAESAADAAMIAAAEQSDKDKADAAAAESAADAAMIAAAEQADKDKADAAAAESAADAAMIAAAEQSEKGMADAAAAESAADAAMIAAAEQSKKVKAEASVAAESAADAAMIAAAEQADKDKADAAAAESAADAAMIAAAQSSADEESSSSAVSYEPQLQTATKTETAKELEFAEPGDSERLQRLLNTIVPQTATETKVAEPEVKVETKVAEPEVKVETKVAETEVKVETKVAKPEVKVETKVAKPEIKVETKVAKPEVKVEAKVAKPEVKVEQVQKIEQVTKAPPQTAEQRMADKLHAINKDWKNVDLGEQFQVLFFLVQGVRFAVPLIDLGGIFECDKITNLFGKPSWFMGITDVRGDKINIVDTLRWVKPDIKQSPEKYPYLISLGMSPWSIGCDVLEGNRTLTSSQIKWREIPGNRPWLAGIVTAEKCALLHVKALIALFEAGADIEDLVRNISEEKGDNGTKGTKNA
ncbi:chemotaxis protein CheW [Anaerobiospirillum succiniciproducens]|uniref:chemotaxis protein CheW n=1 Tax=Anaerobiospirillum succiniciproducens TaxID=13335 RepID=UPI003F8A3152